MLIRICPSMHPHSYHAANALFLNIQVCSAPSVGLTVCLASRSWLMISRDDPTLHSLQQKIKTCPGCKNLSLYHNMCSLIVVLMDVLVSMLMVKFSPASISLNIHEYTIDVVPIYWLLASLLTLQDIILRSLFACQQVDLSQCTGSLGACAPKPIRSIWVILSQLLILWSWFSPWLAPPPCASWAYPRSHPRYHSKSNSRSYLSWLSPNLSPVCAPHAAIHSIPRPN